MKSSARNQISRPSTLDSFHYENLPMQYTENFLALKIENFQLKKKKDIFLIFAPKHRLWVPVRTASEYPQSMFWSKNKKNRYTPAYPSFFYIKVGFKGVYITPTCFPNGTTLNNIIVT